MADRKLEPLLILGYTYYMRSNNRLMLSFLLFLVLLPQGTAFSLTNGQDSDYVVGQANMTSYGADTKAYAFSTPYSVCSDGTKLYIADTSNNRILIYNSIPTSSNASASVVVGQPNMTSTPYWGATTYSVYAPQSVYSDGTKLYVADTSDNRVLIYDPIPTANNASASVVVGQPDMTTGTAGTTAYKLSGPGHAYTNGTKLYVTDSYNNRVLIYDPVPTANNASASIVIGQPDMTTASAGTNAYRLASPDAVYSDGTKLYVADGNSNRVLVYNSIPTANNTSANVVVGQTSMTFGNPGTTAYNIGGVSSVYSNGTKLYVADTGNNRVLVYNSIPASNGASADIVLGKDYMASEHVNVLNARALDSPYGVYSDGTKLYVADKDNNRVLIYNAIPALNGALADVVVGQPDMAVSAVDTTAYSLIKPNGVYSDGTKLYVADTNNNRVLIYNSVPTSHNAPANVVLGQPDMTSDTAAVTYGVSASGLYQPKSVYSDGTKLYISDSSDNRVLIYNSIPSANNASANVAVGQPNMTAWSAGTTAYKFSDPRFAYSDGTKLYIADAGNNRVLIYNSVPTSTNTPADLVVGQADMVSAASGTSAYGLSAPYVAYSDGTKLYVADAGNHRVLIYNSIPAVNNASANIVTGQNTVYGQSIGTTAYNLYSPVSVWSDGTKLYVADVGNNRILIYNSIPTADNRSANVAVGKGDMVTDAANIVGAGGLDNPSGGIHHDGSRLYVVDSGNNRVLVYNDRTTGKTLTIKGDVSIKGDVTAK